MFKSSGQLLKRMVLLSAIGAILCVFGIVSFNIFSSVPPTIKTPRILSPTIFKNTIETPKPSLPAISKSYIEKQIDAIRSVPPTDKFSFAVLSDSHVNRDNGSNTETLESILEDIDSNNYSFAIAVGDLVVGGVPNGPQFFYDIIKDEKTPILTAVGNHDIEVDGGKNYLSTFGDFYYSFSYGNSLFIVAGDASIDMVSAEQVSWLETQLQKDYLHKFVFMHIPFYDPRQNINHDLVVFPSGDVKALLASALMEKYKPDIVFFGHIHAYYDWTVNGVRYITTGGAGGSPVGNDPQHNFHNYIRVDIDTDKVEAQAIKIP